MRAKASRSRRSAKPCKRKAEAWTRWWLEEFVDRGESAKSADRPELQRLLAYVREKQVDYVIVHKIDRLARNRVDDVEITSRSVPPVPRLSPATESIDETPSGMLLHGIMSSIAEFYSRNLANEVIKGSTEKAKRGGTDGKAPIGYRNVRPVEANQEIRTVEFDPVRGPSCAGRSRPTPPATGRSNGSSPNSPTEDSHRRRRAPPRPAAHLSHLHKLLRPPYYKGVVRYRGVEYGTARAARQSPHLAARPGHPRRPHQRRTRPASTPAS